MHTLWSFPLILAIIIVFTNTNYTVDEGIGTLQVDVQAVNASDGQPPPFFVDLIVLSVLVESICCNTVYSSTISYVLTASCANECPRPYSGGGLTTILDRNDCSEYAIIGVEIGFLNTPYTVNKDDGLVNIQVGIINEGVVWTSVAVIFFISQSQSDRGKSNLCI